MTFVVVADEVRQHGERARRYLFVSRDGQEYRVPLRLGLPVTFQAGSEVEFDCSIPTQRAGHALDLHPQQVEVGGHRIILTKIARSGSRTRSGRLPLAHTISAEVGDGSSSFCRGEEAVKPEAVGDRADAKPLALKLNNNRALHQKLLEFVAWAGERNVGVFGTEKMGSSGISLLDFEYDFANLRDQCLRRKFKSCVWVAERQPNTGLWHIHAFVNAGYDIQTGFPFEAVAAGDYRGVDRKLLRLWEYLREGAALWGYGRSDLKPIRSTVERAVSYLSGQALYKKGAKLKRLPDGCGSWGLRDQGSAVSDAPTRLPRHASLHAPDGITEDQEITDAKCPPDAPYFTGDESQKRLRTGAKPGLSESQLNEKFKNDGYEAHLREKGEGWSLPDAEFRKGIIERNREIDEGL